MSERKPLTLEELRKNGFVENAGIWMADNWLAKIREDNNENVQGV